MTTHACPTEAPDLPNAPVQPVDTAVSSPPRSNSVVVVLAFSGIVVSVMQTLVIPLVPVLPVLPALLGASAADSAWAITTTLLAGAVATPVVGRQGDMYGKRRMLLTSLALLVAGSSGSRCSRCPWACRSSCSCPRSPVTAWGRRWSSWAW
ncbi:MFS transporter [Saccharopolyspora hattusasensis]|uniref:MFS transporter n=1 Tax=Saccharopolyspora hattusasensis TaxID=1128679 RepID=UPI003D983349